jgi:hypothetical protein
MRVRRFYEYLYTSGMMSDDARIYKVCPQATLEWHIPFPLPAWPTATSLSCSSQELPDSLLSAVDMEKQRPLIMKVTMFKDVTPACIVAIIRALESEFAPPREYVIVQGQNGDCMYFINKGVVQLTRFTRREGEQPVMQLSDGHHFGEGAIVNNQKRSANALTLTHCYFQARALEQMFAQTMRAAQRNEAFLACLACPAALPGFL